MTGQPSRIQWLIILTPTPNTSAISLLVLKRCSFIGFNNSLLCLQGTSGTLLHTFHSLVGLYTTLFSPMGQPLTECRGKPHPASNEQNNHILSPSKRGINTSFRCRHPLKSLPASHILATRLPMARFKERVYPPCQSRKPVCNIPQKSHLRSMTTIKFF